MDETCAKLPIELNTPTPQLNFNEYLISEKENTDKYSVKFGISQNKNSLLFQVFPKDQLENFCYHADYTFDDFQKLSKGFKMCESIDEILEIMKEIFNSKKAGIKIDKENKVVIILLKIILLGGKEQEIQIKLRQKNLDVNEINKELCNKVKLLENDIKEIKKENLHNIEKMKNLENEVRELKQWKEQYDSELKQLIKSKIEKEKNNELMKKINSVIIKEQKEIDFLEKRLKNNDPILSKKNIIYKLLYRATKDGNSAESFHKKCDNIKGTLIIIKTTKGIRFGGYTECLWNAIKDNPQNKKDNKGIGFCYSLDLFKIYNNTNDSESTIRCYTGEGPDFYGGDCYMFDIYFPIDSNTDSNTGYSTKCKSFGKFEKDFEINNGESKFLMQELEIYQILFD